MNYQHETDVFLFNQIGKTFLTNQRLIHAHIGLAVYDVSADPGQIGFQLVERRTISNPIQKPLYFEKASDGKGWQMVKGRFIHNFTVPKECDFAKIIIRLSSDGKVSAILKLTWFNKNKEKIETVSNSVHFKRKWGIPEGEFQGYLFAKIPGNATLGEISIRGYQSSSLGLKDGILEFLADKIKMDLDQVR